MDNPKEITPEIRLALIELAEGLAEGIRNGTFHFSDSSGKVIVGFIKRLVDSDRYCGITEECNITEACRYLGMSQPTFRKYIREGRIPRGRKREGGQPLWKKSDIVSFGRWWFQKKRSK